MSKTTITINSPSVSSNIVNMSKMKPLQIGRIVKSIVPDYIGEVVMRTASFQQFEVISLSDYGEDKCWTNPQACIEIIVELMDVELIVNIKGVSND